jgi:malate dehydrogenase
MEFVTNEKLTIVGAAGMIGSNMAQTAIKIEHNKLLNQENLT